MLGRIYNMICSTKSHYIPPEGLIHSVYQGIEKYTAEQRTTPLRSFIVCL